MDISEIQEKVYKIVDELVKIKWPEIVWLRIQDYIANILMLSEVSWESLENIIKLMEENNIDKLIDLSKDNILLNNWLEKSYTETTDKEKFEIVLYIKSLLSTINTVKDLYL